MYLEKPLTTAGRRAFPVAAATMVLALCIWFGLLALATPFDHDESQYVAGAYLSTRLLVFRDFLYLQPPLHSWIMAPLAWAFPSDMLLAMRLATAGTALGTLLVLWNAQRIAGISRGSAMTATLLVTATGAFQFSAGVVRNDMLPTLLISAAIALTLMALRNCRPRYWFSSGLLLGLATATKLSFAPIALTTGLFTIFAGVRCDMRSTIWLFVGGVFGVAPMVATWMIAPEAFTYGVFTFAATGPFSWYQINGAGQELTLLEKVEDLLQFLFRGPALIALLILAGNWYATRRLVRSPGRRLVIWMTVGALAGAALPTPSQLQYVMPLIPPLALALGYLLDDIKGFEPSLRYAILGMLGIAAVAVMLQTGRKMVDMAYNGSPVLESADGARWAGTMVRALTPWDHDDKIATLAAHRIIDSGLALDPRFAVGPFVYRTGWTLTRGEARAIKTMIPANLFDMDKDPPDAILVGYEMGHGKLPMAPDKSLIAYARERHYRIFAMPDGIGRLYIRWGVSSLINGKRVWKLR